MGPEHFGWGGWWVFPVIMPIIMVAVLVIVFYFVFGRGGSKLPWNNSEGPSNHNRSSETVMEIVKKRYAKGAVSHFFMNLAIGQHREQACTADNVAGEYRRNMVDHGGKDIHFPIEH